MTQRTVKKGVVLLVMVLLVIALMLTGCVQNRPETEDEPDPTPNNEQPEERQPTEKEDNITEIRAQDKVSTEELTLLSNTDADVDDDGNEESIELYTSAQKDSKGEIMWDDGQKWLLLVRDEDKDYVLFDDFIQLGDLEFWLYTENEGKYHISTLIPASAGLSFTDYTYDEEKNVFVKKDVYKASGINLIYSSRY